MNEIKFQYLFCKFPFNILNPSKLIQEEMVLVQKIDKIALNRNVDNFFLETEQVAFPFTYIPSADFYFIKSCVH